MFTNLFHATVTPIPLQSSVFKFLLTNEHTFMVTSARVNKGSFENVLI